MSVIANEDELRDLVSQSSSVAEENYTYYEEHAELLQDEHSGEIVAIIDGEFAGSLDFTDDLNEIRSFLARLSEEYGNEEVESAYLTHIPDPDQALIL